MHNENPESTTLPQHSSNPYSKPPAAGRDKKPFKAADRNGSKPGSRSEGHRGFHGDAPVAKKRWTTDDRAARTGDRAASTDRRPNWAPADKPARPAYGDRTERPAYGDRAARTERPAYGDRPQRTERPAYNNDRPARSYDERPARTERPAYNERPQRPTYRNDERPARTYTDRPARSYDDRAPRRVPLTQQARRR